MTLSFRIGGTWYAGTLSARIGGAWKTLTPSAHVDSAWKASSGDPAPTPLSVDAEPSSQYGTYDLSGAGTIGPAVASAAGGTGPYTYAWSQVSGAGEISVVSPSSATTNFSISGGAGRSYDAIFQCVATDSVGATATALVAVHFDGSS